MIRPTTLAFITFFFLTACAPGTTTPVNLQASQSYAEQVSENHFKQTRAFREKKPGKAVVPVRAGETFLFEQNYVMKGKIWAFHSRSDRNNKGIVYDQTPKFKQASLQAPEGWNVRLEGIQKRVDFNPSAKAPPELSGVPLRVDMGGNAQIKKQGVLTFAEMVEVSVPQNVQPGRYLVKAEYRYRDDRESLEFIVEVL